MLLILVMIFVVQFIFEARLWQSVHTGPVRTKNWLAIRQEVQELYSSWRTYFFVSIPGSGAVWK